MSTTQAATPAPGALAPTWQTWVPCIGMALCSWLSFVEAWFAILSKKRLMRSELADFAAAERAITDFVATYNAHHAKPFTWRKGVKFYQRLKDKLADLQRDATTLPEAA